MPTDRPAGVGIQWKLFDGGRSEKSAPKVVPALSNDTRIVRYKSLGAFLLLLCGSAFLPSLKRLQEIDKLKAGCRVCCSQDPLADT